MKNYLVVLLLSAAGIAFSQETQTFYQTADKEYAFKFEGETCVLYQLSRYNHYAYQERELSPTDRFHGQLDSLGILFSDGEYAISYDYKYFRVLKLKHGKPKDRLTFVAKKLEDPSDVYEAINHAHWDVLYQKTIDEVSHEYPLFRNYYYRYQPDTWSPNPHKRISPANFEILAQEQADHLKDSLVHTNKQLISLNEAIEKNMNTLSVTELKNNLLSRPIHQYSFNEYQEIMLESVAEQRPELFFDLAEALPDEKKYLFGQVFTGEAAKSLKKSGTDSPVKREFLKYRRRERMKIGLIMTGVVSLQTAVIGGAITGIVLWIRK